MSTLCHDTSLEITVKFESGNVNMLKVSQHHLSFGLWLVDFRNGLA